MAETRRGGSVYRFGGLGQVRWLRGGALVKGGGVAQLRCGDSVYRFRG